MKSRLTRNTDMWATLAVVTLLFSGCRGPAPSSSDQNKRDSAAPVSASGAIPFDSVIRAGDKVAPGTLARYVKPLYPEPLRRRHIEGVVHLRVSVGASGAPTSIVYVSGPKELVKSAEDAVSQWRYRPPDPEGRPTAFVTDAAVQFTLSQ